MPEIILEKLCNEELPEKYKYIDLKSFSERISLFPYQEEALRHVLVCLYKYFRNSKAFFKDYRYYGLTDDLIYSASIKRGEEDKEAFDILSEHFQIQNNNVLPFEQIYNRASFWMATGSGKSIVMIKLIEILFELARLSTENGGIPPKDILILAPKEEILNQIKELVDQYNKYNNLQIILRSLKEWEDYKRIQPNFYEESRLTVFYYRSDNLKAKGYDTALETNYLSYIQEESELGLKKGNWYVLLDEAHKGVTGDSVRQSIYLALASNGFLFNFSATFTDLIDKITTVYNFNLKRFIESGYGKHVKVTAQEFRNFNKRTEPEFSDVEKQNIVLKSIICFTAIKKAEKEIENFRKDMYHSPLMLTIANTIQPEFADLKIFFQEVVKIAKEECDITNPKEDLIDEFSNKEERIFQFETGAINDKFIEIINNITYSDIKNLVFNAEGSGGIEIITLQGNPRELAFKMSTANSRPFALLVADKATDWIKDLEGYSISEEVINESYYKRINEPDNDINILLGRNIFAEGWDSNRPNVINFINIGVGEAQKFVLQALGRGVRIEPFKEQRKRLEELPEKSKYFHNPEEHELIAESAKVLEVVYVFATNKEIIKNILKELGQSIPQVEKNWKPVKDIQKTSTNKELLVPDYEYIEESNPNPFKISDTDYSKIQEYLSNVSEKVLIADKNIGVGTLNKIKNNNNYFVEGPNSDKHPVSLILDIDFHFKQKPKKLKQFRQILDADITHFKKIEVNANAIEDDISTLEKYLLAALEAKQKDLSDLAKKLTEGIINEEKFKEEYSKCEAKNNLEYIRYVEINIDLIEQHYYRPVLLAKHPFKDAFRHIIKEESEITFFKDLIQYLKQPGNRFQQYDWWFFSKLIERIDSITIPYFDSQKGEYSDFYPDFIFWLKKGDYYCIKFIDPKGIQLGWVNAVDKAKGFESAFHSNDFIYDKKKVNTSLIFFGQLEGGHQILKKYVTNNFEKIF